MIRTLDDAWKWYKAVDRLVRNMRRMARADVERLLREMVHPAMVSAAKDLEESVTSGSFRKVTAAYKSIDVDATAQVDQIREFRNWVAHGRRGEPKNSTNPERAVERMRYYLLKLEALVTKTDSGGGASSLGG